MSVKETEKSTEKPGPIPYFSTTMRDGVSVPLRQTLISSGLWGAAAIAAVLLLTWAWTLITPHLGIDIAARADVVAFLVILAGAGTFFPVAISEWPKNRDHWEYIVEVGMGADLNQDGVIGDPGKQTTAATLKLTVNNGKDRPVERSEIEYDELPFAERLPEMARGVISGMHFTFQNWGAPGRLFTQPEWDTLTEAMRTQGYIQYKNLNVKNLGYDFTDKGKQLLRDLIEEGKRIERETKQPTHLAQFAVDVAPLPQLRSRSRRV